MNEILGDDTFWELTLNLTRAVWKRIERI
jgi:hypothetical protein